MDEFVALEKLLVETKKDAEKFFTRGNNVAGTRLRKNMQEVKRLAQVVREKVAATRHAEE